MRGVNLGGWFSQIDAILGNDPDPDFDRRAHFQSFLGRADFELIHSWGFDHVRLPVDYFNLFDAESLAPDGPSLVLLDAAIDALRDAELEVILGLHRCPGHDFLEGGQRAQPLFTDPKVQAGLQRIWAQLSTRYRAAPHVAFELLNEPVAENAADWNRVKDELAALIRSHAPNSKLVVGSNRWNAPGEFGHLTPLDDDNVLYSFHFYAPNLFTHQLAPWMPAPVFQERRVYPGDYALPPDTQSRFPLDEGRWDRARMERELEPVIRFRDRHQVNVACNEFGVYAGGADRGSQLRWLDDLLTVLTQLGFGFTYWNYKNLDFGIRSLKERRFEHHAQYQNPARTDAELLTVLRSH